MAKEIKKIALLTGGGDCPGLNAVIRAIVKTAENNEISVNFNEIKKAKTFTNKGFAYFLMPAVGLEPTSAYL